MDQLIDSLQLFLQSGWNVILALLVLIVPWIPLLAWVAFWLLAVNWEKLYPILAKGGAIGVLLIGAMMILVWGLISPQPSGQHLLFGLVVSNFTGKTVYVTTLLAIMLLCGTVQLSGACGPLVCFADHEPDDDDHGHGSHGDHGGHDGHAAHVSHDHGHGSH